MAWSKVQGAWGLGQGAGSTPNSLPQAPSIPTSLYNSNLSTSFYPIFQRLNFPPSQRLLKAIALANNLL